jgi:regulatory protein
LPGGRSAGLEARALRWLAQREHSRQELRTKLLFWLARQPPSPLDRSHADAPAIGEAGDDTSARADPRAAEWPEDAPSADLAATVDALLDKLVQSGLLSDERFVESRVHVRRARFGNRRIEAELRQHGVRPSPEQLSQLRASEAERARDALRARFGGTRRAPGAAPASADATADTAIPAAADPEADADASADVAVKADDAAQRARRHRFLAARGFSPEAIRLALRDGCGD